MTKKLEEKLSRVLQKPGVYLLKDAADKILYVGKAKRLRARLRSHFKPGNDEPYRHQVLMSKVRDLETIVTDTEVEALILEANFIREHKPRYNVNLKDDKSFPYIRVTHEPYPRVFITRKIIRDGSRYFGPYTDAGGIRQLMAAMRKIFPIRTCSLQIDVSSIAARRNQVCLNFHIGRCKGPCEGRIPAADYGEMIEQVVRFVRGKNDKLVKDLTARMHSLAQAEQFEEASLIRDELKGLVAFQNRQKVVDPELMDRDLLTVAVGEKLAVGVVFNVRDGKITNRRHFPLQTEAGVTRNEAVTALMKHYYLRTDFVPPEVLVAPAPDEIDFLTEWLSARREKGRKLRISIPQRGAKAQLMAMCTRNADLILSEMETQKAQAGPRISAAVTGLKDALVLEKLPMRIEAFDISNTQGTDSVASLVVFDNGRPRKSAYRHFNIKTVQGPDDFASMAEVLERRLTRLLNEEQALPDLILVDGGKGQLSAAYAVLKKLGLEDQPIIGLAKRLEEVFVPLVAEAQTIPKHSPALRLLQQLRDEAHRFAITHHRKRRSKRIISSALDGIAGVGPARRKALIETFGSVRGVREASVQALSEVPGVSPKLAESIKEKLD